VIPVAPRAPLPDRLPSLPLAELPFEPKNEQGVVFLFGRLANLLGVNVEQVQQGFPDCRGRVRGKPVRIEFEYRSSGWDHSDSPERCDWVVCWRHDEPGLPEHLQVIELRRIFGLGRGVWVVPMDHSSARKIPKGGGSSVTRFTVPARAGQGDLVLVYRPADPAYPDDTGCVVELTEIASPIVKEPVPKRDRGNRRMKRQEEWLASLRLVASLDRPITWEELSERFPHANFVRSQMRTRHALTLADWSSLHRVVSRRITDKEAIKRWSPAALRESAARVSARRSGSR